MLILYLQCDVVTSGRIRLAGYSLSLEELSFVILSGRIVCQCSTFFFFKSKYVSALLLKKKKRDSMSVPLFVLNIVNVKVLLK